MSLDNLTALKKSIDSLPFNISARFVRPLVRLIRKTFSILMNIFGNYVYAPIACVFCILKIKFPDFYVERIGHLMSEPDAFLKEQLLKTGRIPRAIMLAPKGKSANHAAVRYWSKYFIVVENPTLAALLKPLQIHPWTKFVTNRYAAAMYKTADVFKINNDWGRRPPLLTLTRNEYARGNDVLRQMGVPEGSWYVCVHAREGMYSPHDDPVHSFRNISIRDFEKSIAYIVAQGGVCIRMGDPTMSPTFKMPGLIDYALSSYKQDWMDLFLAASCKFFLGSNSGACLMATIFGRPSALVGMAPITAMAFGVDDISIQMLYRSNEMSRILTFKEILQSPAASYRFTHEYTEAGITLIHNTAEDILELTIEQFQRVQGTYVIDPDDEFRQVQFKSRLKPGDYCYGTAARIGNAFLKKHQHLLE